MFRLKSDSVMARSVSKGEVFSFVGDVEPINRSIASSLTPISRRGSLSPFDSIFGDNVWDRALGGTADDLDAVGVLAGEDLVGEMDLARSGCLIVSQVSQSKLICHTAPKIHEWDLIPALRACLSARPCRISSSSFRLRSSSSESLLWESSLMRNRKSLTSSEPCWASWEDIAGRESFVGYGTVFVYKMTKPRTMLEHRTSHN